MWYSQLNDQTTVVWTSGLSGNRTMIFTTIECGIYVWIYPSSGTLGRSVEPGIMAPKVFKNRRESPLNATLNEPVPRITRMPNCDWVPNIILYPIRDQQPSTTFVILLYEEVLLAKSSAGRTCLACAEELSRRRFLSENGPPKTKRNSIIGKISV